MPSAADMARLAWFDHADESLFLIAVDPSGDFVAEDINPAAERRTGLRAEDVRGRRIEDCLPPGTAKAAKAKYELCLKAGTTIRYEETLAMPSGTRRWETVLKPLADPQGRVTHIMGSSRDVTRERLAVADAERRRRLLERIVEASPGVIYVHDTGTGRTEFVGGNIERILGFMEGASSPLGEDLLATHVHPDDQARLREHAARLPDLPPGRVASATFRTRGHDGGWRWLTTQEVPFEHGPDGKTRSVIGVATDVTERMDAETKVEGLKERLLSIQEDERRRISRELHDSTVQHLVAASLALMRAAEAAPPEAVRGEISVAQTILTEAMEEIRVAAYLLQPPALQGTDLGTALASYVQGFGNRTGLRVSAETEGDAAGIPPDARAALFRIAQEALVNVHRHSGADEARILLQVLPGSLTLTVSDNGRGFPVEPAAPGTGIAGMRERLLALGGELVIASGPDGSHLSATLPLP